MSVCHDSLKQILQRKNFTRKKFFFTEYLWDYTFRTIKNIFPVELELLVNVTIVLKLSNLKIRI